MRTAYIGIGLIIGFLVATVLSFVGVAHALSVFTISQGGTNASSFATANNAVYFDGTRLVSAGNAKVTTPYASSTSMTVTGGFYVVGTASTSLLTVSNLGNTSTNCLQITNAGVVQASGSACAAAAGADNIATSSAETSGRVPFWTSTAATPALLSGGVAGFAWDNTLARLTATNASTTNLTVGTNTWLSGITSAIALTGADGLVAEYAGTSCTNQFVRSLSALGAATCATVSAGDVSLANLTAGDTTLTFSGTYTGATARTIILNLANANTWTGGQIFGNATTTGILTIPNAASIVLGQVGQVSINSSAASSSAQYHDGTAQRGLYDLTPRGASFLNPAGSTATITIPVATGPRGSVLTQGYCQSAGGGSFTGVFGKGAATTTYLQSSNSGSNPTVTTISSNNTLDAFQTYYIQVGSWSQTTATTTGSCVWTGRYSY